MVIEIMESMNIDSEVALLTNVYEDKPEITFVIIEKLFTHFINKFEEQLVEKNNHERLLLISAWYAISFEKSEMIQYHYKNQPLFGLPFMVSEQMIKLLEFVKNQDTPIKENKYGEDVYQCLLNFGTNLLIYWFEQANLIYNHSSTKIKYLNGEKFEIIDESELLHKFIQVILILLNF